MLFNKSVSEIRNSAVNRQKSEEENMVDDMVHTASKKKKMMVVYLSLGDAHLWLKEANIMSVITTTKSTRFQ